MTDEETKSTSNITLIIIGSIIGGLIMYYLLKPKIAVTSLQETNVSSLEITNRLDSIEQKLQQLQLQQPIVNQPPIQTSSNNIPNTSYKNNEIRKYIRDDKGRITATEIIRNAKIT